MGKHSTWAACGGVALGLVAAGYGIGLLLGAAGIVAGVSAVLALGYLIGTFDIGSPVFGAVARTRRDRPELALTFDDGPDPRFTPTISGLLAAHGHRATFFVLGVNARAYPEVLRRLAADGHEIANHGDDHRLLAFGRPATIRAQLGEAELAVEGAVGRKPIRLFRAPHGVRSPWLGRTAARHGYSLCGWNGRVFDTAEPGAGVIASRVASLLRPGAVILLHDADGSGRGQSRAQTVEALPTIIDELDRRGLRSVPLGQLIEAS